MKQSAKWKEAWRKDPAQAKFDMVAAQAEKRRAEEAMAAKLEQRRCVGCKARLPSLTRRLCPECRRKKDERAAPRGVVSESERLKRPPRTLEARRSSTSCLSCTRSEAELRTTLAGGYCVTCRERGRRRGYCPCGGALYDRGRCRSPHHPKPEK